MHARVQQELTESFDSVEPNGGLFSATASLGFRISGFGFRVKG